jgi:tetratricopeptide (TPR) repeat protein
MTAEEGFETRFNIRLIKAIKDLDPDEFKSLMVRLLSEMGMKVSGAVASGDEVFVEGERDDGKYLAVASRRLDHASTTGLKLARGKAAMEGRKPILVVTGELDDEARRYADEHGIAWADRGKLISLLTRFGLTGSLVQEIDRRMLERSGSRYLPSIGRFDSYLQAGEEALKAGRYRDALEQLQKALDLKPQHDLAWERKASAHLALKEYDRALEACQQSLNIRSDNPSAWFTLGLVLDGLGRYQDEIKAYDNALKYQPRMRGAMLNKAATLFLMGSKEKALPVLDDLLRVYPDDETIMTNRGIVLKSLGRSDEALEAFESVVARDPSHIEALTNRAALLVALGRGEEAVSAWKEAVVADRKNPRLWFMLGSAQKEAGLIEDAVKSFDVALTLDPEMAVAARERDEIIASTSGLRQSRKAAELEKEETRLCRKYIMSSILLEAIGEFEGAVREADRCAAAEASSPEAYRRKAAALLDLGRIEEAMAALSDGLREFPRDNDLLLDLEALTFRMGQKDDCLKMLDRATHDDETMARKALIHLEHHRAEAARRALPRPGRSSKVERARALALMGEGRHVEAGTVLRLLLSQCPTSPELLNDLGVCYRFAGRLEEAEGRLHQAVEADPQYADAWNNLGCVHYLQGACEDAARCFSEAVLVDRKPEYLLNQGMCYLSLENVDAAREAFTSALQLDQSAEALNGLGIAAEREKELARALEFYEAALRRSPDFRDAQYNRARIKAALQSA